MGNDTEQLENKVEETPIPSVVPIGDYTSDPNTFNLNQVAKFQLIEQQAISRQPHCDTQVEPCQYFELNVLGFSPTQPWLTTLMWQSVALVLSPEAPLASDNQQAKNTILKLIHQIEYGDQSAKVLPLYQRVDTSFVFNPTQDSQRHTGYLAVMARQIRTAEGQEKQTVRYVMVDLDKKLQLSLTDVLKTGTSTDELLTALKPSKLQWLEDQGVNKSQQSHWPLALSDQWYLDEEGLHMVYQGGEIIEEYQQVADLLIPYDQLETLIKPDYLLVANKSSG